MKSWFMTCGREGSGMVPELRGEPLCGPTWTHGIVCVYAQLQRPREGRVARGALVLPHLEGAGGGIKRGTAKSFRRNCSLIGLHLLAADHEVGSSGS